MRTRNHEKAIQTQTVQTSDVSEVAEEVTASLNPRGAGYALALIMVGKIDRTSSWSFSAEDGNEMMRIGAYPKMHLGLHADQPENAKGRYAYPFGKNGKVYRSAMIAIKQRAPQQGDMAIETMAEKLLNDIDGKNTTAGKDEIMTTMRLAYSTLDLKAVTETVTGKRLFKGIASTPTTDFGGDIMEPKGAEFTLPLPFLWQHDAKQPVGWIHKAIPTDAGIEVDGEVATIVTPGKLKDRLDEAWDTLKAKLVRGLSIGFVGLTGEKMKDGHGTHYKTWRWHELSAVTVPMNMDANITMIKSLDQEVLDEALAASAAGLRIVPLGYVAAKSLTTVVVKL